MVKNLTCVIFAQCDDSWDSPNDLAGIKSYKKL